MTFDVNFWELLALIGALLGFFITGIWAFARIIVKQFSGNLEERFTSLNERRREANTALEERFDGLRKSFEEKHAENRTQADERFQRVEKLSSDNEKSLLVLRAELPNSYVMREDWIRFSGTIDSKLDGLRSRLDSILEKRNA